MAWNTGGFFAADYLLAAGISLAVLGVLLVVHLPRRRLSSSSLLAVAALAGLVAWSGLSASWAPSPDRAVSAMQLDLCYLGLFGLGLMAAGSGRYAGQLVWATLLAIGIIVGAGLLSRLDPHLVHPGPNIAGFDRARLMYPLSYSNAFGAMAAIGSVLALGLAADPRARAAVRSLAAGGSVVLFVAMSLSLSRGAWLALGFGLLTLVALGAHRLSLLFSIAVIGGMDALAAARLATYPVLVDNPARAAGQLAAGRAFSLQLLLLVLAAAGAHALVSGQRLLPAVGLQMRRAGRVVALALTAVVVLFAAVAYGSDAGSIDSFVTRQWNDFLRPTTVGQTGTARLTSTRGTRSDLYRVALDGFAAHPWRGDGAGSFRYRWILHRRVNESVQNAHSLELETLDELGIVGGLLVVTLIGSIVAAAVRSRLRRGALRSSQSAAVGAACAVWIVHSFVDWDWQMPALSGAVLILAATLFPRGRRRRRRSADTALM